jgi:hypothetical protein
VETPLLRRGTDSALKRYQRMLRIRLLQDRIGPAPLGLRRRRQPRVLPLL